MADNQAISLPRYRTVKESLIEIKKFDKDTAISEWFIRNLCKENIITSYSSGNKLLVSLESLIEYLGGKPVVVPPKSKYFC
ncbi:MAG: hypothetical protein SPL13_05295 [Clostridia bacterium]|nr:hypothetical protein [Clostridia bacterium]